MAYTQGEQARATLNIAPPGPASLAESRARCIWGRLISAIDFRGFAPGSPRAVVLMVMSNAAMSIGGEVEIVTLNIVRGAYTVAVYETASLGWAANYGALETYNHPTRAAAIASLRLSLEVCRPACSPDSARGLASTLRAAEHGKAY